MNIFFFLLSVKVKVLQRVFNLIKLIDIKLNDKDSIHVMQYEVHEHESKH